MYAIEATGLTKRYRVYHRPLDRALEALRLSRRRLHREFTALDGIDLEVPKGQTTGVIGPNGAGKSTLLKILAGIIEPTQGELRVHGSVASIIELGAGFHPEFTGAENVRLNAGILDFSQDEIDAMFDRVCRFSELGEYIHMPVKTYSSGMFARLAFSIAINLNPEILLVDEALAVGDAVFANRCLAQIRKMRERGVTIFFVSHDASAVSTLCDHVLLLDRGRLICEGPPKTVIGRYQESVAERLAQPEDGSRAVSVHSVGAPASGPDDIVEQRFGTFEARITSLDLASEDGASLRQIISCATAHVRMRVIFEQDVDKPIFGVMIKNRFGVEVFGTNTLHKKLDTGSFRAGQSVDVEFELEARLGIGIYTLSVAVHHPEGEFFDYRVDALVFEVIGAPDSIGYAALKTDISWEALDDAEYDRDVELLRRVYGDAPSSIALNGRASAYLSGVWYQPHDDAGRSVRWMGKRGAVCLTPPEGARRLGIETNDPLAGGEQGPGRLTVKVDNLKLGSLAATTHEWSVMTYDLPDGVPTGEPVRVTLEAEREWVPREVFDESLDDRSFGFAIARVWFE